MRKASDHMSFQNFSSTSAPLAKVAVLGAAGGIGQPLSLLCKLSNEIDELACYDIVNTPGVAADLSHVSTAGLPGEHMWKTSEINSKQLSSHCPFLF